jgi:hypothetical protein
VFPRCARRCRKTSCSHFFPILEMIVYTGNEWISESMNQWINESMNQLAGKKKRKNKALFSAPLVLCLVDRFDSRALA